MDTATELLKYALSTINPSTFCKLALIYQESSFRGVQTEKFLGGPHLRELSQAERTLETSEHHRRFEFLRELHKARDFRVVLCVNVWEPVGERLVERLKGAVAAEKARDGFDEFHSIPSVTYNPRSTRQ